MIRMLLVFAFFTMWISGCGDVGDDACTGVTCGGHGTCRNNVSGAEECICDSGYQQDPNDKMKCVTICDPTVHDTQGPQENLEIMRYRFVGGSANGSKVAVLFSHFGSSSSSPFANLYGYEEGIETPLFYYGDFLMVEGTEEALKQVEDKVLADGAADLAAHGLDPSALPTSQAFCQDEAIVLVAPDRVWEWKTAPKPCPSGAIDPMIQWQLCMGSESACVEPVIVPEQDCGIEGEVRLLDVFLAEEVWWVVGERITHPFNGLNFVMRSVGGRKP